jgi:hypothetical protein
MRSKHMIQPILDANRSLMDVDDKNVIDRIAHLVRSDRFIIPSSPWKCLVALVRRHGKNSPTQRLNNKTTPILVDTFPCFSLFVSAFGDGDRNNSYLQCQFPKWSLALRLSGSLRVNQIARRSGVFWHAVFSPLERLFFCPELFPRGKFLRGSFLKSLN